MGLPGRNERCTSCEDVLGAAKSVLERLVRLQAAVALHDNVTDHDASSANISAEEGHLPVFDTRRLERCVDWDRSSPFNRELYRRVHLQDGGGLRLSPRHLDGRPIFWGGMAAGCLVESTELLVFAEERFLSGPRLVCRITMERASLSLQVDVALRAIAFYQPKMFGVDKTGIGLPLYQELDRLCPPGTLSGQNLIAHVPGSNDTVMERSTDVLREEIDRGRLHLPRDSGAVNDLVGETYTWVSPDAYGRPRRAFEGCTQFGTAARMAFLARDTGR